MPTQKKYAYRKLVRDLAPPYKLRVKFYDSETDQPISNLDGYELLDTGNDINVPAPSTGSGNNDTPSGGNGGGGGGQAYDGAQDYSPWGESTYVPSKGSGNFFKDAKAAFGTVMDIREAGKKLVRDFVVQTTGITDLFGDELNPTHVTSSANGVDTSGTAYNVPPAGYRRPKFDEANSPGAKALDLAMQTEEAIPTSTNKPGAARPEGPAGQNKDSKSLAAPVQNMVRPEGPVGNNTTIDRSKSAPTPLDRPSSFNETPPLPRPRPSTGGGLASNNEDVTTTPSLTGAEIARNVSMGNQTAVRNQPVNNTVMTDFAAVINKVNPNIRASINSGGQEPLNTAMTPGIDPKAGENRIGMQTVNHDIDVNNKSFAFDSQFELDGEKITPATHPEVFREIGKWAAVAGFTQFGMEGGVVHLGKDPKDKSVRTWGYPGGLPESIAQGIQEGLQLKKENPELYPQMVQEVARNDPQAPTPQLSPRVVQAVDAARGLAGLAPISGAVKAGQNILGDVAAGITNPFKGVGELMNQPAPFFGTVGNALEDAGKAALQGKRSISGNAIADQIRDAQPLRGAAQGIASGIQSGIGALADTAGQIVPDVVQNIANAGMDTLRGFMGRSPIVGSQNPKQLAEATGTSKELSEDTAQPFKPVLESMSMKDKTRLDAVVRTILGEAVGEGYDGQVAVANVIKNRALSGKYPLDPLDVVNQNNGKTWQFSANAPASAGGNAQADKYPPGSPQYEQAKKIAELVFGGYLPDNTGGALMYHASSMTPYWADEETKATPVQIGNHTFYPRKEMDTGNVRAQGSFMPRPDQVMTTPTGSAITAAQKAAIGSTSGGSSSGGSTSSLMSSPSQRVTAPTGGSITAAQRDAISGSGTTIGSSGRSSSETERTSAARAGVSAVGSGSNETTIGSNGRSSSETERTSAARSGSSAVGSGSGGVMSRPTTNPSTTSSSKPSPIVSGSSAVGSAGGRTTSPNQSVTTSSGGTITKAQSDAIRRL